MPFSHTIHKEQRLVHLAGSGRTTHDEWRSAMEAAWTDPEYQKGFHFLTDIRGVQQVPTANEVKRGLQFLRANVCNMEGGRIAVLVSGLASFGMGRMAGMLAKGSRLEIEAFTELAAAVRWLLRDDLASGDRAQGEDVSAESHD